MADEKDCGAQRSVYYPDHGKTITFTCTKWADHPASHYDFHGHEMWPLETPVAEAGYRTSNDDAQEGT